MKKSLKMDLSVGVKRLNLITNRLVNAKIVGGYRSVFKGRGLEFLDYRQYTPNDDASLIDWKASIKGQELLIKEFAEERNLNVFFLIDASSGMICGSIDKLKMEYAAELVSTLSYTILQAGDSIGFAFFADKILRYEMPRVGFKQYYRLISDLVNPSCYGGNHDLNQALKFTMASLKEFSIIIIVSDFIGLKNDWKHYLKLAGKKFDLIGIMVRDPIDEELPEYNGQAILGDYYSDKQIIVNVDLISEHYSKYVQASENEIINSFHDANADFVKLTTDKPFLKPITDLFIRRTKKIR